MLPHYFIDILIVFFLVWKSLGLFKTAPSDSRSSGKSRRGLNLTSSAGKNFSSVETEIADFAAGCFLGVESEFRKLPGVIATIVGFEEGNIQTVRVEFDPRLISYGQLLHMFWNLHDPTSKDRQGVDVGPQYRSTIFCHSPEQMRLALASRNRLRDSGQLKGKIVTEISPASIFTAADEPYQRYVEKGGKAACYLRTASLPWSSDTSF